MSYIPTLSTAATAMDKAAARQAINSSSAFDSDESDYDDAEDSLAIKRRGGKAASAVAGPSRSGSGSAGEASTLRKVSRRYEEMEVPNWCSVCDRLIAPQPESAIPAGIVGGQCSPQIAGAADDDALMFGRQVTIKQRKRREGTDNDVDPGMPVVAAGPVKPVFSRKMKVGRVRCRARGCGSNAKPPQRTGSNGVPARQSTALKRTSTSHRLHSSRNLVAAALAAAEAPPAPVPAYNTELYCSEACAKQDEALVAQQISGLQSLYLESEEEERQRRMSSLAARRYSEWSEVSSTGHVLPPSPLFIGGSDTDSTSATSLTASERQDKMGLARGVTSPLDLEDDFDYFRMQTEGVEHGLMERSRRRSLQSARSSSGGQSGMHRMQRTVSHTGPGALAPVPARTILSSSDSLSSMWSEGRSDDGWRAGASLKPMTPLKSTFGLPPSEAMRPTLSGGRSLSHGKTAGATPMASGRQPATALPSAEFGSAPAAAHLYQSYPLALPRTGSSRDVTLMRAHAVRSHSHQPLPEVKRHDSDALSTSWKMHWDQVVSSRVRSGVSINGEQKLSPVAGRADEATTPTQSLVQVMTSRSSVSLERTASRDSASTTTSRSSEVILEEDERAITSPMPTLRRRVSPQRVALPRDSPTVAITIGDDVYSTASPPSIAFCHSLPRRMSRRASLLANEAVVAAPADAKPSWQQEAALSGKLYELPIRASAIAETGRLFTFHH